MGWTCEKCGSENPDTAGDDTFCTCYNCGAKYEIDQEEAPNYNKLTIQETQNLILQTLIQIKAELKRKADAETQAVRAIDEYLRRGA
jgi:DNA-directed RNA polymerase subunit RPC12/RpoP